MPSGTACLAHVSPGPVVPPVGIRDISFGRIRPHSGRRSPEECGARTCQESRRHAITQPQRNSSRTHLDIRCIARIQPIIKINLSHQRLLRPAIRTQQSLAPPVTIRPRPPDHGTNGIPVSQCRAKRLDVNRRDDLVPRKAVGFLVKRFARAVGREDTFGREGRGDGRRHDDAGAGNDGGGRVATLDCAAGLVEADEGCRTSGFHDRAGVR